MEKQSAYQSGQTRLSPVSGGCKIPRWRPSPTEFPRFESFSFPIACGRELDALASSLEVSRESLFLSIHHFVLSILVGDSNTVTGLIRRNPTLGQTWQVESFSCALPKGSWKDLALHIEKSKPKAVSDATRSTLQESAPVETAFHYVDLADKEITHLPTAIEKNPSLSLIVQGLGEPAWELRLLADASEFTSEQITAIGGYYLRSFSEMALRPESPCESFSPLSEGERRKLIEAWNDTRRPYPEYICIHQLFEKQAMRQPSAPAIVTSESQLSYGDLEKSANQLAHFLVSRGMGPGNVVACWLPRRTEAIVALLAILKTGAAYLPVEASLPGTRVASLLSSAKVSFTITTRLFFEKHAQALAQAIQLKEILFADNEMLKDEHSTTPPSRRFWSWTDLHAFPQDRINRHVSPKSLAYIIFTSGSTGVPKGVQVVHQTVINVLDWVNRTFEVSSTDQVLFVTSFSFDLSVYDIFGSLGAGAMIRLASDEELGEPARLARILQEEPITFWDSAPAALQQLVPFFKTRESSPPSALRLVFLSGDWVPLGLADQIHEYFPHARMIALGGATEATIWSNYYCIEKIDPSWQSIPYGKPIQNAEYYVLDAQLRPCPIGTRGDLYIGGDCLSIGYLNDPALTAGRFVANPFRSEPGSRMYKTGDLARFFPDGNIEFLGRGDNQIKLRGYRVELGEIESTLRQHPSIGDALVIVANRDAEMRLLAYVIPRHEEVPDQSIREFLKERLPSYMVPAAFCWLQHFPLNSSGKIDRSALPEPQSRHEEIPLLREPDSTEKALLEMWAEILKLNQMGLEDHFFDSGGHSLVAIQLVARMRKRFECEIPLRSLFDNPTVTTFAIWLQAQSAKSQG